MKTRKNVGVVEGFVVGLAVKVWNWAKDAGVWLAMPFVLLGEYLAEKTARDRAVLREIAADLARVASAALAVAGDRLTVWGDAAQVWAGDRLTRLWAWLKRLAVRSAREGVVLAGDLWALLGRLACGFWAVVVWLALAAWTLDWRKAVAVAEPVPVVVRDPRGVPVAIVADDEPASGESRRAA